MEENKAKVLWERYRAGDATEEEQQLLLSWFHSLNGEEPFDLDEAELEEIHAAMRENVRRNTSGAGVRRLVWRRVAVVTAAAAAVTVMIFGIWFFNSKYDMNTEPGTYVNDVAPGKNGATLTLANGEVVELSAAKSGVVLGGSVVYSDGSAVRYSSGSRSSGPASPGQRSTGPVGVRSLTPSDLQGGNSGVQGVQNLTATTAKGQTYLFTLPDGTRVWLNADSRISFPAQFSGRERKILLSGEGYFEVEKDKAHPFIVESKGQRVEVLGTHFNLSAYGDDPATTTTLVEGSVRVTAFDAATGRQTAVLKPNEQSIQNAGGGMQVRHVDVSGALDWKKGEFVFSDNENIVSIMRRVSRWYDVDVRYVGDMEHVNFTGSISRTKNISAILKLMERTGQVRFKIEGRKVIAEKD